MFTDYTGGLEGTPPTPSLHLSHSCWGCGSMWLGLPSSPSTSWSCCSSITATFVWSPAAGRSCSSPSMWQCEAPALHPQSFPPTPFPLRVLQHPILCRGGQCLSNNSTSIHLGANGTALLKDCECCGAMAGCIVWEGMNQTSIPGWKGPRCFSNRFTTLREGCDTFQSTNAALTPNALLSQSQDAAHPGDGDKAQL